MFRLAVLLAALFLILLQSSLIGEEAPPKTDRILPESVGAISLSDSSLFPEKYRDAARVVAEELRRDQVNPSAFYARVEASKEPDVLIFHLWHEAAFRPENLYTLGNPGGQCRDFYYDLKLKKVTKKLFWK